MHNTTVQLLILIFAYISKQRQVAVPISQYKHILCDLFEQ